MNAFVKHMSQVEEGMTLLNQIELAQIVRRLELLRAQGGTVYLFGNGGSASTACHFVNDLTKMARVRAVCIPEMMPTVYAHGNDTGWENMFLGPLTGLMTANDGAMGISCSGKSENVITALEWAAGQSDIVMGMTGMADGSPINAVPNIALVHARVPDIRVQEDLHLIACHAIVREIQERGYAL